MKRLNLRLFPLFNIALNVYMKKFQKNNAMVNIFNSKY